MNYDGTEAASLQGARFNRDPKAALFFSEKTQEGAGGWHSGPRPAYLRPSSALRPPGTARETIPLLNGGGLGWPADVVSAYWTEGAMTSPPEKRPGRGGRTNLICLSSWKLEGKAGGLGMELREPRGPSAVAPATRAAPPRSSSSAGRAPGERRDGTDGRAA